MSLEFGGYKGTCECARIQFIQVQLDEDFQEDAEVRRNNRVLFKRAAVLTGLRSETGAGDSAGLFGGICPLSSSFCYTAHPCSFTSHMYFPPWWLL